MPGALANEPLGDSMDLGLAGKDVLVVGGTKSVGRAIVDACVVDGAMTARVQH
jgi:hypothetical protein